MSYCTQCGSKNDDDARFCNSCGSVLSISEPQIVPGGRNKKSPWLAIAMLFILACALTYMHLTKTGAQLGGEKSTDTADTSPETENTKKPSVPDAQDRASQVVDRVFGSDQEVGELPRKPTPPKDGLTDVESSGSYHYQEENCDGLYSDIFQQGAYSIQQELLKATKISEEEENKLGREVAKNIVKQHKGKLDVDKLWVNYIRSLGNKLVSGVNRKGIDYHFHVIHDDMVNAFAVPGGGIYFFTGILDKIENEAQLAGIIAHEVKHVDLRHCIALYQVLSQTPQFAQNPITFKVAQTMKYPYSARQEADADRRGLLGRVLDEIGNVVQAHPKNEKRACLLKNHILKLQKKYHTDRFYVGRWNYQNKVPMFQSQK